MWKGDGLTHRERTALTVWEGDGLTHRERTALTVWEGDGLTCREKDGSDRVGRGRPDPPRGGRPGPAGGDIMDRPGGGGGHDRPGVEGRSGQDRPASRAPGRPRWSLTPADPAPPARTGDRGLRSQPGLAAAVPPDPPLRKVRLGAPGCEAG
ncbi:hypothetical protein GCM10027203_37320 [Nonomuraea fastidiosa]